MPEPDAKRTRVDEEASSTLSSMSQVTKEFMRILQAESNSEVIKSYVLDAERLLESAKKHLLNKSSDIKDHVVWDGQRADVLEELGFQHSIEGADMKFLIGPNKKPFCIMCRCEFFEDEDVTESEFSIGYGSGMVSE